MSRFLRSLTQIAGEIDGDVVLPLPKLDVLSEQVSNKDRVHLLETCIVAWTKQIKFVLKKDPEDALKGSLHGDSQNHPGPLVEIEFWKTRALHLNSIVQQLQSPALSSLLGYLDEQKSTYNQAFAKLCRDVFEARFFCLDTFISFLFKKKNHGK